MAIIIWILLLFIPLASWGAPETLEELLQQVREHRLQAKELNQARINRFLAARNQQKALLEKARAALQAAKTREEKLSKIFAQNEEVLAKKRAELKQRSASLEAVFAIARQAAHELAHTLNHSLISAQFPGRAEALAALADSKALPTIEDLRQLWLALLKQMVATGKVVTFSAPVITASGEIEKRPVSRVGPFTAVSQGQYLRYLAEPVAGLVVLNRQPSSRFLEAAAAFKRAEKGEVVSMTIDPSRGAILSLMVRSPDLLERVNQGGWIGYLTLALGAIALLIALYRFVYLLVIGRRIDHQRQEETPDEGNPLGRILRVYTDDGDDVETLNLKLDEAILKEVPAIERGLPALAILAEIAPLLGLLGTVIGMIQTFQSITMFGTSDPTLMSAGISKALVTTVLGLAVAIPILLIHSALSGKSNRLIQVLDEESAAIVAQRAEASLAAPLTGDRTRV